MTSCSLHWYYWCSIKSIKISPWQHNCKTEDKKLLQWSTRTTLVVQMKRKEHKQITEQNRDVWAGILNLRMYSLN